jgi:CheY-like chemotaxis protein
MTTQPATSYGRRLGPVARPLRRVAVVSAHPDEHVLETVLGAADHDVVLVESTANAYSHIRLLAPDLVIVCLSAEDVDGCRVLSMLKLDRSTASIPVVTCMTPCVQDVQSEHDGEALLTEGTWTLN